MLKFTNHTSVHSTAGFLETFQNEVLFSVKISMMDRIREDFFPLKDLISQLAVPEGNLVSLSQYITMEFITRPRSGPAGGA